ncbi:unnamed protein product [Oreochromis niloticus]|nr:unnamed protein product [Mustela putorius furo]CAI5667531.1 unnamed protein product [Mustela putorius furo]
MTHHSFGTPSALSPASFRPTAASTPARNPLMDLATPPPSPHRGSSSPAAMLADSPLLPPSPQGWNSPSHPALGWQSPEQTPPSTSVSGASLWAWGDPVCRVLFREHEDNDPHPGESLGQLSPVHNDEAATLLPTAVFELIKLTLKYLVMSLLQKHRQDVCQGCAVSHPSQRRHSCLFPLEKYYFFKYYDELCKRLWNGHFTNTLLQILRLEGFSPPPEEVRGVAQAYLFELRDARDIEGTLQEIDASVTEVTRTIIHKVLDDNYSLWLS